MNTLTAHIYHAFARYRKLYPGRRVFIIETIAAIFACTVLVQIVVLSVNAYYRDRPVIGARVGDQRVGLLRSDMSQKVINQAVAAQDSQKILLVASKYRLKVTSRQLGIRYDTDKLQGSSVSYGHRGSLLQQITEQDASFIGHGQQLISYSGIDTKVMGNVIATMSHKIESPPTNAYFEFTSGSIAIHSDVSGRSIDSAAALALLKRYDPSKQQSVTLPVVIVHASVMADSLKPLLPAVAAMTGSDLSVTAGSSVVVLSRQDILSLVAIVPAKIPSSAAAQISFDNTRLNAKIDSLLKTATVAAKPKLVQGTQVIDPGAPGLASEGEHPKIELLTALIKRQSPGTVVSSVTLPLAIIAPPVVQQGAPQSRSSRSIAPTFISGNGSSVFLTIDDGPGLYTEKLLDILHRYNAKATFYLVGRNAQANPATIRRIQAEGHRVANHSYSHADLARLSESAVSNEITTTQSVLASITGQTPSAFRPPYGSQNATIRSIASALGLSDDLWSVDPRDWAQPGVSVITDRVLSNLRPGAVILLHVLHQQTVDALPGIIEGIHTRGYTIQ